MNATMNAQTKKGAHFPLRSLHDATFVPKAPILNTHQAVFVLAKSATQECQRSTVSYARTTRLGKSKEGRRSVLKMILCENLFIQYYYPFDFNVKTAAYPAKNGLTRPNTDT